MTRRLGIVVVLAASVACSTACAAETLVQRIPFEYQSMTWWSAVMAPWGIDRLPDWVISDGGKTGRALRITTALNRRSAASETRCIQFNHEPGTAARIQLDVNPVVHPAGSRFRIRWFDGYVSAEAFHIIADDEFAPWPPPLYECSAQPGEAGWQHVDFRTPRLEHTVLTIALMISQPEDDSRPEANQFIDYLLDDLSVETVPLARYADPGFDWHGKGGNAMLEWRHTIAGAHVDWCDFMEEIDLPWRDGSGRVLHFTMDTFRDHGLQMMYERHDFSHSTAMNEVGGASTIALVRNKPGHVPASFGVRQTVSYAALGLGPNEAAHLQATIKYTVLESGLYRGAVQGIGVLQLGCDPKGGLLTEDAIWTDPERGANWLRNQWRKVTLEWDRPEGATAFTVYFRYRDGECRFKKTIDCTAEPRVTYLGSSGVADWIMIRATKRQLDVDES